MAATKIRIYQDALRHLGDARLSLITDDVESRYALDDAWDEATSFVLRQAPWRFAVKTATLVSNGSAVPGFSSGFAYPGDWLRTHAIFLSQTDGRECPLDLREQGINILTNASVAPVIRYISNTFVDPTVSTGWPEHFAQCVAAYLAFLVAERVTGDRGAPATMSKLFASLLPEAVAIDALPEDFWLPFQRNGMLLRGARHVLRQGFWRFAIATAHLGTPSGTPQGTFTLAYPKPADWLLTHALYLSGAAATDSRQCPFDIREHQTSWSTNATIFYVRYVSTTPGLDSTKWTEGFQKTLGAYLEFEAANRSGAKDQEVDAKVWLAALSAATPTDCDDADPWLDAQLDGTYQRVARAMVDQGFWRFAMVTGQTGTVAGGTGGFSRQAAIPADASRTRSLYVLTTATAPTGAGERRPFKIREHGALWYTDELNFYAEYVSLNKAMDSTLWPDHYTRGVLRAIHFDKATRDDDKDQRDDLGIYKDALAEIVDSESVEDDPWLERQLDGSFDTGSRAVLSRGYWWWGLKAIDIDSSTQESLSPQAGFPYRYELPSDWLRTHAAFVAWDGQECPINIRETNEDWSTDAAVWTARYVSTDVLDAKTWPEQVAAAVLAYLDWTADGDHGTADPKMPSPARAKEAAFDRMLGEALTAYSRPEDNWLRHQLDGRYIEALKMMLEKGRWRFAVKTVTLTDPNNPDGSTGGVAGDPNAFSDGSVSPGYSCRMPKPLDWLRTLRVYYSYSDGYAAQWFDPDYRDELGAIHVNRNPVQMRYVSRLGLDATQWPQHFRDACLAWCEHVEARADPKMAAVAARKLEFYERQCAEAETLDDERDVPRVINTGRFVAARYGRSQRSREEGWGWR